MHVGRYAPSPTGELHLGNARTALLAWLWARTAGGRLLLRFEDLDVGRVRPGIADRQADDLRWLGLDWDGAPAFQSDRLDAYAAAIARLEDQGLTYPCFCSRSDIRAAAAPHGDEGPTYAGTCRPIPAEQAAARLANGEPASLRLRLDGTVDWLDQICGRGREDLAARCGDIVVRRRDGVVAYQLAVVVDDHAQGVTHVLRGDDLLGSTARQLRLRELLGLAPVPVHAHVPLLLGPDGSRLAKRDAAPAIGAARAAGADPRAIVGWLAHSAGLLRAGRDASPDELVAEFSLAAITRGSQTVRSSEPWSGSGSS